jgi:tripartite-type tricarboxylate transporter receptor subunit TctC
MRISAHLCSILSAAAIFQCGGARAQDYPVKTVRIVVPFTAGGGTDIMARSLAQRLTETMGHGEITKALGHDAVRQRLAAQGIEPGGIGPEKFAAIIKRDLARWQKVIRQGTIKPE